MEPVGWHLLPDSSALDGDMLTIGGIRCDDLVSEFGSPLFVYDEQQLQDRCREAVAAFGPSVAFASKSFLCRAMAKIALEAGMKIDVASGGELAIARSAGYRGDRIVMHGNNKSSAELAQALDASVGRIVIDSFDEMDRIEALCSARHARVNVMVRVTPGVEVHTFDEVQTGQADSKFGFGWHSGDAQRAIERVRASTVMDLVGVHMHIGSQVFSVDNFAAAVRVVAPLVSDLGLEEFCIGGGLGVAYVNSEEGPTLSQWATSVKSVCEQAGVTAQITAEPGRSIVAQAAITLYTVGTIKHLDGIRTYMSVDGGMSDNPRPVLYGSGYEACLVRRVAAERSRPVRLVGKHCESGDVLVKDAWLPDDVVLGDLVATPVTGAYGYSLASNYNKLCRPAVVFVRDGSARVVVRRETVDDLLACDVG